MKRTAYITVKMNAEGESEKTIRALIKEHFSCCEIGIHGTDSLTLQNPRVGVLTRSE